TKRKSVPHTHSNAFGSILLCEKHYSQFNNCHAVSCLTILCEMHWNEEEIITSYDFLRWNGLE
ncbi:Hypothetical predicted protein, partial [Pelobates cultripes]